jgi:polyvinyl alcohol dehydrogenase (cytochrome)
MFRNLRLAVVAFVISLLYAGSSAAQLPKQGDTARIFTESCATCHGNPSVSRAPAVSTLRQMTPESIYAVLTTGNMREQGANLSDDVKRALTIYLSGRQPGIAELADAKVMSNHCSSNPAIDLSSAPSWNGFGLDTSNTRYQPAAAAGLTASQVSRLKLKWAFGFPAATVVYSQPSLAGGRIFVGVDTGYVYSLDAATGCVYWSFAAQAGVRSAVSVGALPSAGAGETAQSAAYFGDIRGNVYALNARTGELVWKVVADAHPIARITAAPKFYQGRLYVPVASMEEGTAGSPSYECCTFRGSVVALDGATGKQLWKTFTITASLQTLRKNSKGTQQWGPSGGGVWNSPTIDPAHHAIYIGTGDAYSPPVALTTDAIMALDMDTGKVLWSVQDTPNDAWIAACWPPNVSDNCPKPLGPDYDFGASPILRTLADGHRLLLAGQKSGTVWAHDPDNGGVLKWKMDLAPTPATDQGEIAWGGAADEKTVYFGLNSGGIAALNIADGSKKWFAPLFPAAGLEAHHGQAGPLAVIPGVVFSDGWDGVVRALSTEDGHILWQYDTIKSYDTVNGVAAKGGSMGAAGPIVAGGVLFVPSGYIGVQNGLPGNVLLAFSAQ